MNIILKSNISLLKHNFQSLKYLSSNVKPFYYQELFEHAKKLDIPFKKLTGKHKNKKFRLKTKFFV
jgi:hypothetical protein